MGQCNLLCLSHNLWAGDLKSFIQTGSWEMMMLKHEQANSALIFFIARECETANNKRSRGRNLGDINCFKFFLFRFFLFLVYLQTFTVRYKIVFIKLYCHLVWNHVHFTINKAINLVGCSFFSRREKNYRLITGFA